MGKCSETGIREQGSVPNLLKLFHVFISLYFFSMLYDSSAQLRL